MRSNKGFGNLGLTILNCLLDDKIDRLDEDECKSHCQAAAVFVFGIQPAW